MPSYQERIAAIDAEIAELDQIIRAPQRKRELLSKRMDLERKIERDRWLAITRIVDPGYEDRLAAARADLEAADAELRLAAEADEANRVRATARKRKSRWSGIGPGTPVGGGEMNENGTETLRIAGGPTSGGRVPIFGELRTESTTHRLARERAERARRLVQELERRPAVVAAAADNRELGEATEERIRNAGHVSFGVREFGGRFRQLTTRERARLEEPS